MSTDREQIARQLLKHADIREVMNLGRWTLAALLADVVGALQDMLTPLAPEGGAEIPVTIGRFTIVGFGHRREPPWKIAGGTTVRVMASEGPCVYGRFVHRLWRGSHLPRRAHPAPGAAPW